jgi:dipeptidyl aminopeptidase/acylaminoacyl peptidase
MKRLLLSLIVLLLLLHPLSGQQIYEKPPQEILDVLHAPLPPLPSVSPARDVIAFVTPVHYPPITDLARPMLRLAGIRVNPANNADRSYTRYYTDLTLKRVADLSEEKIQLPAGARIGAPVWNANGSKFAFTNETATEIELWVMDMGTRKPARIPGVKINPILGSAVQWLPDQKQLLVKLVPYDRGAPPASPVTPPGPRIQESSGATVASSTYEMRDVLKNPHDADLFDYYATSQLALVDPANGTFRHIGQPGLLGMVAPDPEGRFLLVESVHRPYSYQRAWYRFPKLIEIWNMAGEMIEKIAGLPLADQVPIDGVPIGPRHFSWHPVQPATLTWVEALDGGDPRAKVPQRDRIMFKLVSGPAREFCRTKERFNDLEWIEGGTLALLSELDRDRHWLQVFLLDTKRRPVSLQLLWDRSVDEKYGHPGYPLYRLAPNGVAMIMKEGNWIYLDGNGSSPEGDRPFLDRLNLRTFKSERLFRSDRCSYEYFVAWIDLSAGSFLTRHESPSDPPNFFRRSLERAVLKNVPAGESCRTSTAQAITRFVDPTPHLRGITKRMVTFTRADGIPLSFMLYLPPDYKPGTRLPTVFWAYPLDYAEGGVAGQIEGSTQRFTTIAGTSELFFLLAGYAVLADVAMPVVGPPENAYDSFIEQIVANARAAIDKAVELGVTDPDRIGVGGHSHGALMTANLLAWSDLFRAGIARSGAYNHTLRPFGFQNENRTYWQARESYIKLSPVMQADKINEPLLLIHGELDVNPGTVPMQSEKLYEALRGVGGTTRLVMLPYESHGYQALESTEHVLYEMISWFDRYVKKAPPRSN